MTATGRALRCAGTRWPARRRSPPTRNAPESAICSQPRGRGSMAAGHYHRRGERVLRPVPGRWRTVHVAVRTLMEPARELLVLGEAEVQRLLDLDELVDALAAAFVELSEGRTSVPPRVAARTGSGLLAAMPGYLPGAGLGAKLVTVFPGNHAAGLPSHLALITLFDDATGRALAVMDGTYITAVRTAAGSALSARLLARTDSAVLAILGGGGEGRAPPQGPQPGGGLPGGRGAPPPPGHP